jgi:hypothetical protein
MKNITFSADDRLIRKARERAAREHTNLNAVFREWLARYAGAADAGYDGLMESLEGVRPGRTFSREELNER